MQPSTGTDVPAVRRGDRRPFRPWPTLLATITLIITASPAAWSMAEPVDDAAHTPSISAASAPRSIYGPGINIDSRSNRRVNSGLGIAHRFRAKTTAKVPAILFQPRWGRGYSAGDGGRYRVSIQTDDDSASHLPSGHQLASFVWKPGNKLNSGYVRRFVFPSPPRLVKGRIYHVVFHNIHDRPDANYVSINETMTFERLSPRQPRFGDGIYAVLNGTTAYGSGRSWAVDPRHTPVMDIVYSDGRHQGMAYLGPMRSGWGAISGSRMVRERFRVRGRDRHVTAACVRIGRQRGSDPLTIRLERGSGRAIETMQVQRAGTVARSSPGSNSDNGDWVCGTFDKKHVLRKGRTYNLRLSTPSSSQYSMTPLLARDYTTDGKRFHMKSFHFREGAGQKSTNGGATWSLLYEWYPQNMQFYFVVK